MASTSNHLICVGVIVGAQGIKGHVKIKSFSEDIEYFLDKGDLYTKDGSLFHKITPKHKAKGNVIAEVEGVTTRSQAEGLKNTELYVQRDQLPELEEETFYHADLIDLEVRDTAGKKIGKVLAIHNFGAGDMIEFLPDDADQSKMILFRKDFVPEIHIKDGYIVITPEAAV
jgi:16S rRNA processing protein RimM